MLLYAANLRGYQHYAFFGDDPAVMQGALSSPSTWFTQGFSKYFYVFSEWTTPYTDFLRPGVDLILRLEHTLFGNHFSLYFLLFYLAQAFLIALFVTRARYFGLSSFSAIALGILLAASPAFINLGLYSIVNHFDV